MDETEKRIIKAACDFVDMHESEHDLDFLNYLEDAVAQYRAKRQRETDKRGHDFWMTYTPYKGSDGVTRRWQDWSCRACGTNLGHYYRAIAEAHPGDDLERLRCPGADPSGPPG